MNQIRHLNQFKKKIDSSDEVVVSISGCNDLAVNECCVFEYQEFSDSGCQYMFVKFRANQSWFLFTKKDNYNVMYFTLNAVAHHEETFVFHDYDSSCQRSVPTCVNTIK